MSFFFLKHLRWPKTDLIPTSKKTPGSTNMAGLEDLPFWWYLDVSESSGTPKSSILIGFSIINHPFWGIPIFGNTHFWGKMGIFQPAMLVYQRVLVDLMMLLSCIKWLEIIPFIPKPHWTWCFFSRCDEFNIDHLSASCTCQQLSQIYILCFNKSKTKQRLKIKHVVTYYAQAIFFSDESKSVRSVALWSVKRCEFEATPMRPRCKSATPEMVWVLELNEFFFFKILHGAFFLGSLKLFPKDVETFFFLKVFQKLFHDETKKTTSRCVAFPV